MKAKPIPKQTLDEDFKRVVRGACQSLADVCYNRIMDNPVNGMRHLSNLASILNCHLVIDMKTKNIKARK